MNNKKELHKTVFMLSPVMMVDNCNCNYWEVRGRSIKVQGQAEKGTRPYLQSKSKKEWKLAEVVGEKALSSNSSKGKNE
jgi:hypothetical protein